MQKKFWQIAQANFNGKAVFALPNLNFLRILFACHHRKKPMQLCGDSDISIENLQRKIQYF